MPIDRAEILPGATRFMVEKKTWVPNVTLNGREKIKTSNALGIIVLSAYPSTIAIFDPTTSSPGCSRRAIDGVFLEILEVVQWLTGAWAFKVRHEIRNFICSRSLLYLDWIVLIDNDLVFIFMVHA